MKTVIGIVLLGAIVAGLFWLNDVTRTEDGKSILEVAPDLQVQVDTATPETREIVRTVQAPGEVEAFSEVDISSEIVSKIVEMPVEEGDVVSEGDLVCRLDDADYRARLLSAEANVARLRAAIVRSEAAVEKAQLDYEQERRLVEVGATSRETVTQYRTVLVGARADLEMCKQELISAEATKKSAEEDLERTVLRAPISGVVSQRFAKQGEVVVTGTMNNPGTRIMVISDLSKMQIRCRVDEADAPLVERGHSARIYLQSDTRRSIAGRVLRVGTKGTKPVGRDVVTFETLVLITGDDPRVKPGMTANVEIEVARKSDALTIPIEAVVYRRSRDLPKEFLEKHKEVLAEQAASDEEEQRSRAEYIRLVYCVKDGKARPHVVRTGINDAAGVEILDGLAADAVVVTGPYRSLDQLKDGTAVKINEKPDEEKDSGDETEAEEKPEAENQPAGENADQSEDADA